MYGYIYRTTNLVNGRMYIGKHKANKFDTSYLGSGKILKQAFDLYGRENFKCEILEETDVKTICESLKELNEAEKYYIKYYDCVQSPLYYNIATGGDGGHLSDKNWYTDGVVDKFIKVGDPIPDGFRRGRTQIAEYNKTHHADTGGERNGMFGKRGELSPNYGKHHSDESREKMSKSWNYEKHNTPETRLKRKINNQKLLKEKRGWYSEEAKKKTLETKIKNGTLNFSEETKKKMSEKAHKKKVMCVETGIVYNSTMDAERKTGHYHSAISKACKNKERYTTTKSDGTPKNNKNRCHWVYVDSEEV